MPLPYQSPVCAGWGKCLQDVPYVRLRRISLASLISFFALELEYEGGASFLFKSA